MDKMEKAGVVWFIGLLIVIVCLVITALTAKSSAYPVTTIEVNNPSSLVSVQIEIKCDFNFKIQRYTFYDWVTIKKSSKTNIVVPYGLRKCELWPRVRIF